MYKYSLKLSHWIRNKLLNLHPKTLIILIGILIGLVCGMAAFLLKILLDNVIDLVNTLASYHYGDAALLLLPIVGIILTNIYFKIFHPNGFKRGIAHILYSIRKKNSDLEPEQTYGHIFSSSLTVGFGGSTGFEAPIVATGAAIGTNIAKYFKFGKTEKSILLAAGAAAGISAVFNAPIAGVLFAIEVLLVDFSIVALIPLLLSSATAAILAKLLYPGHIFVVLSEGWVVQALPFYIILGATTGFMSIYVIRINSFMNNSYHGIKNNFKRIALGSIVLGSLIFIFPPLFGEGYYTIINIFNHSHFDIINPNLLAPNDLIYILLLIPLVLIKMIATTATLGAGGNGGTFAPSLFMGALIGFFIASIINFSGLMTLNIINFTAIGMAGMLSGVIRVPLTAVFLIAEITGGYILLVPLMIVSAISYFISSKYHKHSIYDMELDTEK